MTAPSNPLLRNTIAPPVMEARRWIAGVEFPPERPLLNFSQAAPVEPPPPELINALTDIVKDPAAHLYGPDLGLPELRAEIAAQWSAQYGGAISPDQVAVTSGCNQAFCTAIATLATAGENVILPAPYYFNHKMWLDMCGVEARLLPCADGMLPDIDALPAMVDARTRAIVLVTPNNPTGAEYPPALIRQFAQTAKAQGLALIVDETYRDFRESTTPAHGLFSDADWPDYLIHLYSFSKVFHLTGHRVGAMVCGPARLAEAEKFIDTTTICPNQIGQRAALFGLQHLSNWVAQERIEILRRLATVRAGFAGLEGWRLLGSGAYFAYAEHPYPATSDTIAKDLVQSAGILILPGSMFTTHADGAKQFRIAFANADQAGLEAFFTRLAAYHPH